MEVSKASRQCVLIAIVEVLTLAVWFSASAVLPSLQREWGVGAMAAAWLTAIVQLGFVAGAVLSALLNVSDRIRPHRLLAACAVVAALCTALLPLTSEFKLALALRFATGFALAGVYPVGMMLVASWSPSKQRGKAFGLLLAALTVGSALPHLIKTIDQLPWQMVLWVAAGCALSAAGICALFIRQGPCAMRAARPNSRYVLNIFREPGTRLANIGYFGHMWELYAWWAWLPTFLLAARGKEVMTASTNFAVFLVVGIAGAVGCIAGGRLADAAGRPRAAGWALAISGLCCLLSPLIFVLPEAIAFALLALWGAAIVADSGVFSTVISETAKPDYVGTALTVQTAAGFLLTNVSMIGVPFVADKVGWQFALLFLFPGPVAGIVAMIHLNTLQASFAISKPPAMNDTAPDVVYDTNAGKADAAFVEQPYDVAERCRAPPHHPHVCVRPRVHDTSRTRRGR